MRDTISQTIGVVDEMGSIISCSQLSRIGEVIPGVKDEVLFSTEKFSLSGYSFAPISSHGRTEYYVFVEGEDIGAERLASLLCISLGNIKALYDEKYDKASFIKNVILDNILPSDIYVKSKELHLNSDVSRVVYLVKFNAKDEIVPIDVIQNIFTDKNNIEILFRRRIRQLAEIW